MSFKIGSFNCLNFGLGASKDAAIFADIIRDEQFDIVALQEIKGKAALNRIMQHLRTNWAAVADDSYVNDYAFIWNTNRIRLAETFVNGKKRIYEPRIYKQYKLDKSRGQRDLVREPFYARFFPAADAPFIEIRLINTHIRYSGSKDGEGSLLSLGEIAMRKNEFDVLTRAIYAKEADKEYGNSRPWYTILLGDYNLNIPNSGAKSPYLVESFTIDDRKDKPKCIVTRQSELTTLKKINTASDEQSERFANNYDHFTYDENRFSSVSTQVSRVNTVEKYCGGDYEKHQQKISDHVPIAMNIDLRG